MAWQVPITTACASQPPCYLVSNGWNATINYADDAVDNAYSFLDSLYNIIDPSVANIPNVSVDTNLPVVNVTSPAIGGVPAAPTGLELTLPVEPTLDPLVDVPDISVPAVPEFLASFPTLTLPAKPTPSTAVAPGDAPAVANLVVPDAPTTTIPDVPNLLSLNLPTVPTITLPTFTDVAPDPNDVGTVSAGINWSEDLYSSTELDALKARLQSDLSTGAGGLPDSVIDALWNKGRERENREYGQERGQIADEFAARGFELPPGVMARQLRDAARVAADRSAQVNREAVIEEAQRKFQYLTQTVIPSIIQIESDLMQQAGFLAQRAFDAQVQAARIAIDVYQARIALFNARLSSYQTAADVFKTKLEAELTKLEIYKAELDGQKLIGDINLQDLEAYKASLDGVRAIVDIYRSEVDAVNTRAEIEKTKLEAYSETVRAYQARVQARAVEFQAYSEEINGELAKVRLYESSANAYNAEVNGYRALVDAESSKSDARIANNRAKLDKYTSLLGAFNSKIQADVATIGSKVTAFDAEIKAYQAGVQGEVARTDAERQNAQVQVELGRAEADLRIKAAETELRRSLELLGLYKESLVNGATTYSTLAASAWSAVNLSAEISGSSTSTI